MRTRSIVPVLLAFIATPLFAQSTTFNLRDMLTDFLRTGITLADPPPTSTFPTHAAHFIAADSPQFMALQQFATSVATQLSSFPLASPAGGFTYTYDPALGVFTRASESFGPIYAERASTIGKGKFNIGINRSHFAFDKFDGLNLRGGDVRLVFTHQDVNRDNSGLSPFFEGDLVTGTLLLKVQSDITAFVMTFGATDRFDFGAAIPVVSVSLASQANVSVQRIATGASSPIHVFKNGTTSETVEQHGSASGVGDVVLRGKFRALLTPRVGLAFGTDVRLPTGEERDLLGTGTTQIKPYVIGTLRFGAFSPHVNAGYGWNATSNRSDVPDEISYTAGFDWAAHPKMTLAVDVIGRDFVSTRVASVRNTQFVANTNTDATKPPTLVTATFPQLISRDGNSQTLTGSVGVKVNPVGNALITINGLFGLGNHGLQTRFAPLVGLEYSF